MSHVTSPPGADDRHEERRVGWWARAVSVLLILLGVVIGGGGLWLAILGGSWYYLIAGTGLIVAGARMARGDRAGVGLYALVWLGTLVWAVWEVGLDPWPLVPRTVAPTVILALALLALPGLYPTRARRRPPSRLIALAAAAFGGTYAPAPVAAQTVPAPVVAEEPAAGEAAPAAEAPAPAATEDPAAAAMEEPAAAAEEPTPTATEEPAAAVEEPAPAATEEPAPAAAEVPAVVVEEPAPAVIEEPATATDEPAADEPAATPAAPSAPAAPAGPRQAGPDWPAYGATLHARRYSTLDQIDRTNVGALERVWSFHTGDLPSSAAEGAYSPENTPLKIGDSLYVCTAMNVMIGLDAATGVEKWRYDPGVSPDAIPYGATCRGVAYHEDPQAAPDAPCARRVIEGTLDARLIAVDADTGRLCVDFGEQGMVDLGEGIGYTVPGWYAVTTPPTIVRGVAVIGAQVTDNQAEDAPSGVVRGYDAVTGELAWAWDLGAPGRDGAPPEGEAYTRGTPNMWTIAAGDEALGLVYLPMGNSAVDYYGANRSPAENEYSTALVALDVTTGEPAWTFQTVHYDVWDYDLGSQPSLVDFPTEGGAVPALILPSKQGQIYVLDRATGEPLHPVEERPVPSGGVEPENLSPTQPYSGYASLARDRLTERDMWGMSPIDQLWCRIQFRRANYEGEYTPPSADRPFIQYPGYNGGSDWGSVAVDPERGTLIANYNDMPNYNRLVPREEADERGIQPITAPGGSVGDAMAGSPYAIDVNAGWRVPWTGLLCKEPPYGWIRGIDLATGATLWEHPFGSAVNNGPFGIPSMLPVRIGTPNNGGPIATAGGLIFIAATTDDKFRAFDIETGEELWQTDLPAGGQTTPITYAVDGRQFVVIAPGGHHFMETAIGDEIIAYALPAQ